MVGLRLVIREDVAVWWLLVGFCVDEGERNYLNQFGSERQRDLDKG